MTYDRLDKACLGTWQVAPNRGTVTCHFALMSFVQMSCKSCFDWFGLRCIYISEFRMRFRNKLAHFAKKKFISKCASLVQNREQNCASVNAPSVCLAKKCELSYSWFQTSQTGGQQYSDTSPFSIPWPIHHEHSSLSKLDFYGSVEDIFLAIRNLWFSNQNKNIRFFREKRRRLDRHFSTPGEKF